jgi:membrane protein
VFAAITFTIARALFTTVMSKSSYTLVYGAFAAVPLFLLWIYVTWIIVLAGAVLTHGLSAYQSSEQERTPLLIKALDTLYLFWRAQQEGRALSDLDVIGTNEWSSNALDADSWRLIRDRLSEANILKRSDRGRYLLCRDLHSISLADLAKILRAEPAYPKTDTGPLWRQTATGMLTRQMEQEAQELVTPLAVLFASTDA